MLKFLQDCCVDVILGNPYISYLTSDCVCVLLHIHELHLAAFCMTHTRNKTHVHVYTHMIIKCANQCGDCMLF